MLTWLDQRTGAVTAVKGFLTEDVPGGASYWYAFGSATVFAMMVQIATGIFLCFFYAPSTATAYESTKYLIEKVPAGHLVLSLHYWGASAMIAFMAMHLLQGLLWGAYKKPRELQWVVGVILFIITLVLGLTGYLLPWDLNALLASRVAINVAGNAPVLGPAVLSFLQDGSGINTLTINRFFGIHVWLMPALLAGSAVHGHRALVRNVRDHRRASRVLTGTARRQSRSQQRGVRPVSRLVFPRALCDARHRRRPSLAVRADREPVRDRRRSDAADPAADRAAVHRPKPVAPAVAAAVGSRHHRAGDGRRDRAQPRRAAQRRRGTAGAQDHRPERAGRRRERQRLAGDRTRRDRD